MFCPSWALRFTMYRWFFSFLMTYWLGFCPWCNQQDAPAETDSITVWSLGRVFYRRLSWTMKGVSALRHNGENYKTFAWGFGDVVSFPAYLWSFCWQMEDVLNSQLEFYINTSGSCGFSAFFQVCSLLILGRPYKLWAQLDMLWDMTCRCWSSFLLW